MTQTAQTSSRFAFLSQFPHFPAALQEKATDAESAYPAKPEHTLIFARAAAEKITEYLLVQIGLPAKGNITNPLYRPGHHRSTSELDLGKQTDRLFVLLRENLISPANKDRFDFIRIKGNAAVHGSEETSPQDAATALDYLHELCRSLAADFPEAKTIREPGIFATAGNGQSAATSSFAGAAGFRIGKLHNRLRSSIATSYQPQVSPKLLAVFFGAFLMLIFFSHYYRQSARPEAIGLRHTTLPNGDIYEGALQNGQPTGAGKIIRPDGTVCQGSFISGQTAGSLTCTLSDGSRYEGMYRDGINGIGSMVYANGSSYKGGFQNGLSDGMGEWRSPNGTVFNGKFAAGRAVGGFLQFGNGESCHARVEGDILTCNFNNGLRYTGRFDPATFAFHGEGVLKDRTGQVLYSGEWQQGQQMQPVQTEAERLRTLAEQGNAAAQNELGVSYFEGQIVPRDDAQAFLWIGRAARQGLPEAQTNLARLYEQGRGTAKNTEQAVYWYSRAAEQGYPAAAQRLNELRSTTPAAPAAPEGSKDSLDALF
mgnify:FL=1